MRAWPWIILWLLGCGTTEVPPTAPATRAATTPRPVAKAPNPARAVQNVVLVTVDTMRGDIASLVGGPARTPVLDALGAAGWVFTDCYSAAMLTNPAHASLMTSLYPRDHGVYDNESGVEQGVRTLAGALKRHGMRTGAVIGFRHLNPEVANLGQGFEIVVPAEREERRATDAAKAALAVIDELEGESKPRQRGFFVWLHLTDPHAPYEPPDNHPPRKPTHDTRTPINAALRAAPGFQRHNPWFAAAFKRFRFVEPLVARYIAEVEAADEGLGVLVAGLAERGHSKDTAVVVTADHGENLGEHGLYFNHGGLYRSAVHVPLIVSHKSLKPGRFDALTATVDIAPTILSLVGAPRWEPMRGRDLVRVANGLDPGSTFVYSEHTSAQLFAVRSKTATMIWHRKNSRQFPTYPFVAGRRELYDQSVDPGERAPKNHDAELALELDQARQRYLDVGLLLTARQAVVQDRASLRRLGYIE